MGDSFAEHVFVDVCVGVHVDQRNRPVLLTMWRRTVQAGV